MIWNKIILDCRKQEEEKNILKMNDTSTNQHRPGIALLKQIEIGHQQSLIAYLRIHYINGYRNRIYRRLKSSS